MRTAVKYAAFVILGVVTAVAGLSIADWQLWVILFSAAVAANV